MLGLGFQGSLGCAMAKVGILGVNLYFVIIANLATLAGALHNRICCDWPGPLPTLKPVGKILWGALYIFMSLFGKSDDQDNGASWRPVYFYVGCLLLWDRRRDSIGGGAEVAVAEVAREEDVIPLV